MIRRARNGNAGEASAERIAGPAWSDSCCSVSEVAGAAGTAAHVDQLCVLDEFILDGLVNDDDFGLRFDDHGILRGREVWRELGRK